MYGEHFTYKTGEFYGGRCNKSYIGGKRCPQRWFNGGGSTALSRLCRPRWTRWPPLAGRVFVFLVGQNPVGLFIHYTRWAQKLDCKVEWHGVSPGKMAENKWGRLEPYLIAKVITGRGPPCILNFRSPWEKWCCQQTTQSLDIKAHTSWEVVFRVCFWAESAEI